MNHAAIRHDQIAGIVEIDFAELDMVLGASSTSDKLSTVAGGLAGVAGVTAECPPVALGFLAGAATCEILSLLSSALDS